MKNRKVKTIILTLLCAISLVGCSAPDRDGTDTEVPTLTQDENTPDHNDTDASEGDEKTSENAEELLSAANLNGSVSDFQTGSFQVVQTLISEDGQEAAGAAPGAEGDMESINVYYEEDCVFQIANINSATGEAKLEAASAEDVKKSTNVSIYGEWQENGELHAAKVILTRYQ